MTTLNLLCLPYSGASAMVYSRWRRKLPAWLQVRPVELPGRGARMAEPSTPTCRRWPGNWPPSSACWACQAPLLLTLMLLKIIRQSQKNRKMTRKIVTSKMTNSPRVNAVSWFFVYPVRIRLVFS